MTEPKPKPPNLPPLEDREFNRIGRYIESQCGIRIPPNKRVMVEARLHKRLRAIGVYSFSAYCDLVFGPNGGHGELQRMIDTLTTNKTDFFREPHHFDILRNLVLPERARLGRRGRFTIWSAGCSTGEEPYTLAMVLTEYTQTQPEFDFAILATDLSTEVLDTAQKAIYDEEKTAVVPNIMKRKYLLRSRDKGAGLVRIVPELRRKVSFHRLNLMDETFGLREVFEVVFCRNVMIYFDRPTQERLVNHLCQHIQPGGYLFVGHSETLHGLSVPLTLFRPTVYRRLS